MSRKNFEARNGFGLISTLTRKEGMNAKRSQRSEQQQISFANSPQKVQIVRTLSDVAMPRLYLASPETSPAAAAENDMGSLLTKGWSEEDSVQRKHHSIQADIFNHTLADPPQPHKPHRSNLNGIKHERPYYVPSSPFGMWKASPH